mgnify:CR=1 FL=1
MKILKDAYTDLENKLGRTPMLIDHLTFDNIDPIVFFNNNSFKNYADVINKFSNKSIELTDAESNWLSLSHLNFFLVNENMSCFYFRNLSKMVKSRKINLLRYWKQNNYLLKTQSSPLLKMY